MIWHDLIETMREYALVIYNAFSTILTFFNTSIYEHLTDLSDELGNIGGGILQVVIDFLLENNELANMPLWGAIFGLGVTTVIVISIVKWFVDLVK